MGIKLTKAEIKQVFSHYQKQKATATNLVRAAVLVPLFYQDGEYYFLFTQRSGKVTYHKGQISFPGGVQANGAPSLLGTTLRESCEEIGLKAEDVEILGELNDTVTLFSGFVISPFVAFIPYPYPFEVNSEEIDEIFDISVSDLLKEDNLRVEYQIVGNRAVPTYFCGCKGKVIWGATARIVVELLELLSSGWKAPA